MLQLQWGVLALIAIGTVEMAVWFFMFDAKNRSGVPTPCNVCGPVTLDYVVASVLTVFKRALSRCLLLSVSLGFGVVRPTLERPETLRIAGLGLAYAVFGVLDEMQRATTYDTDESFWVLGLLAVDVVCFVWTYSSLTKIQKELEAAQQGEKLRMYSQLQNVITACAAVYCIMALVILLIRLGAVPLDWKSLFFLINFWDLLYLGVLLAVAYIWAPGESSFRYAWYSQPPSGAAGGAVGGNGLGGEGPDSIDEAVEDDQANDALRSAPVHPESVGIEMTAPSASLPAALKGAVGAKAKARSKRPVPIVEEDDEDDFGDDQAASEADTRHLGTASKGAKIDTRALSV